MLVLAKKQKFGSWRRDSPPLPFLVCIENACLFAEEGISLVVDVLHNLGPRSSVLHSERSACRTKKVLIVEIRHIACIICSAGRQLMLLQGQITLERCDIIEAILGTSLLIIYRLKEFELFGLRGSYLDRFAQTHDITARGRTNVVLEVVDAQAVVQRDAPSRDKRLFGCVERREFFELQLRKRILNLGWRSLH